MRLARLDFSNSFSNKVDTLLNKELNEKLTNSEMNIIYELFRNGSLSPGDSFWGRLTSDKSNTLVFLRYISKMNSFKTNNELLNYLKEKKLNKLYKLGLELSNSK